MDNRDGSRTRPTSTAGSDRRSVHDESPRRPRFTNTSSYASLRAPSSIRIRRLPSATGSQVLRPVTQQADNAPSSNIDTAVTGRRRSLSAPQRPFGFGGNNAAAETNLQRQRTVDSHMPAIREGNQPTLRENDTHPGFPTISEGRGPDDANAESAAPDRPTVDRIASGLPIMHSAANAAQRQRGIGGRVRSFTSSSPRNERVHADEYSSDVIDLLDLVDPEVQTMNTLTNLQNSLFVPDLGSLVNRRPTYDLTRRATGVDWASQAESEERRIRSRAGTRASRRPSPPPSRQTQDHLRPPGQEIELQEQDPSRRTFSISSELSDSRYAVLPHGVSLEGWSDEEVEELNDHVRHLLHSRREGFKRNWAGFRKYVSKPLGLFVVLYATLVTLFGAAWVFCLIGWVYIGNRQDYFINVIDNVLVALFALMGDGLAPFRMVDTYHMTFIAHYHHLTWRLRQEKKLPDLADANDLPNRRNSAVELEDMVDKAETTQFSVLSPRQQQRLQYHQAKFNKSHTFYKPHETSTHHAFPLRLLVAVVVLLDCHSLFQVALGTCTWSIAYKVRPQALTATILSCSITCNIVAGVLISIGDRKTRKKDVLEKIFRQGLTEEALRRMAKTRDRGQLSLAVDPAKLESTEMRQAAQAGPVNERSLSQAHNPVLDDDGTAFLTPREEI